MGTILIWMTAALILGQIFRTLSLPVIVGFIASGYLFSIVDFADEQGLLEIPSEIGIELLLFSIGLKIRPSYFLNPDLVIVFLLHSLMVGASYFLLIDLEVDIDMKIFLCIALTFSSTIIASKSLESRKELTTFHGRLAIIFLIFQDILALLLLLYSTTGNISAQAFYLLILPLSLPIIKRILSSLRSSEELELIGSIVIALFVGAFLFKTAGLTGEIGALTMGILLSNHEASERLSKKIWSLREILLLAFFISLGMKLTIDIQIIQFSLMVLTFLILKSMGLFILLTAFKLRAYTAFLVTVSLSTYSEFLLILTSAWDKANLVSEEIFAISVCTVCLSFILGSTLNKYAHELYVLCEKFLVKFERSKHHPDEQPHTCGDASVMIVGMGKIGNAIFENLQNNFVKVVGFDADMDCVKNHLFSGKRVTFADVEDPSFWSQLRFGKLTTIVLALPGFHAQNWSVLQARKFGFNGQIIVPTRSEDDEKQLKLSGADHTYDPYKATALGVTDILLEKGLS
tara:strand:+ start:31 stop:1578 length:1548 start_codon:yes stop_codon:yes gene_type:complete